MPPGTTFTAAASGRCFVEAISQIDGPITTGTARVYPAVKVNSGTPFAAGFPAGTFNGAGSDTSVYGRGALTLDVTAGATYQLGCAVLVGGGDYVGKNAYCSVHWICH